MIAGIYRKTIVIIYTGCIINIENCKIFMTNCHDLGKMHLI